jgi:nitric oxide reductase large subunit
MAANNGVEARQALKGGVVAGIVGGVVMSVFMVLMNVLRGADPYVPLKAASYPFLGELAFEPGLAVAPILLGVATHLMVSIGWGILFGVLFYGLSKAATLGVSLVWGVCVWLGMFYVVLPLAGVGEIARGAPRAMAVIEHLLFGLSIGLGFLPFQRTRPRPLEHRHGHGVPAT